MHVCVYVCTIVQVCVCACRCVFVHESVYVYVGVCVYVCVQAREDNVGYYCSGTVHSVFEKGSLIGLELARQARLAGQGAPGIHLFLPP